MPRYLFMRVVHNDNAWKSPSPGRLRFTGDGKYLEKTGFGHEDWNFADDVCSDGNVNGYLYYRPRKREGAFNILFASYDKWDGWTLAGYYKNARFVEDGGNLPAAVIKRRAVEVKALEADASLGRRYRGKSVAQIAILLKGDQEAYRWHAAPKNVRAFQSPIKVPKSMTLGFGKYFTRPKELTEKQWVSFLALNGKSVSQVPKDDYRDGGETEFPEGRKIERKHTSRERNRKLVEAAKARFKAEHGRLFCEACEFDFQESYGRAGINFIEAHHTIPVSKLKSGAVTKLSDVALVCSNCHRILHHRRPWLSILELKRIVRQMRT